MATSTGGMEERKGPVISAGSANNINNNHGHNNTGNSSTRRGMIFHPTLGYAIPPPIPLSVARRNARERNRVKTVNSGFECLRLHVPSAARAKKMSKVDILKHSVEYIRTLQKILDDYEDFTAVKQGQPCHQDTSPQEEAVSSSSSSSTSDTAVGEPRLLVPRQQQPQQDPQQQQQQQQNHQQRQYCQVYPSVQSGRGVSGCYEGGAGGGGAVTPSSPTTPNSSFTFVDSESGYGSPSFSTTYSPPPPPPPAYPHHASPRLSPRITPTASHSHPATLPSPLHPNAPLLQAHHHHQQHLLQQDDQLGYHESFPSPPIHVSSSHLPAYSKLQDELEAVEEDDILDAIAEWQES